MTVKTLGQVPWVATLNIKNINPWVRHNMPVREWLWLYLLCSIGSGEKGMEKNDGFVKVPNKYSVNLTEKF